MTHSESYFKQLELFFVSFNHILVMGGLHECDFEGGSIHKSVGEGQLLAVDQGYRPVFSSYCKVVACGIVGEAPDGTAQVEGVDLAVALGRPNFDRVVQAARQEHLAVLRVCSD